MNYVDGFLAAVPIENKQEFVEHSKMFTELAHKYGALEVVDCWEDDVPEGENTSMPLAVKKQDGEAVVFSWIIWPSKEIRDSGMQQLKNDPKASPEVNPIPFDGRRLIFGGFDVIHQSTK